MLAAMQIMAVENSYNSSLAMKCQDYSYDPMFITFDLISHDGRASWIDQLRWLTVIGMKASSTNNYLSAIMLLSKEKDVRHSPNRAISDTCQLRKW